MKKSILIAIAVVLVLVAAGCSIDPSLANALDGTVWTNNLLVAGSRLAFDADGTGGAYEMLLGDWTTEPDDFTYTYDPASRTGVITPTGSVFLIVAADDFDGDIYEFTVSPAGNTISFRGWTYNFGY